MNLVMGAAMWLVMSTVCAYAIEVQSVKDISNQPSIKIWKTLNQSKVEYIEKDDSFVPKVTIPPEVAKLDGKPIAITGFIFPLEESDKQNHFLLITQPSSCPFHPHVEAQQMVEVWMKKPIAFTYDPVTIAGTLTLDPKAEMEVIYLIKDGR